MSEKRYKGGAANSIPAELFEDVCRSCGKESFLCGMVIKEFQTRPIPMCSRCRLMMMGQTKPLKPMRFADLDFPLTEPDTFDQSKEADDASFDEEAWAENCHHDAQRRADRRHVREDRRRKGPAVV